MEIWKDIPGFEGTYQASSEGRIMSFARSKPTILENYIQNGYKRMWAKNNDGIRKQWLVHRLIALTFLPNPNNYPVINHKNGNGCDNRVENLEWCTVSHNNKHQFDVLGRTISDHHREINSRLRKGKPLSAETRARMSAANKGRTPKNVHLLHTKEARQKVADKLRGAKRPKHIFKNIIVPVDQYTKDGALIASYESFTEASEKTGVDRSSIINTANGKRKSAGGFVWAAKQQGLSVSRLSKELKNKRA